MIKHCKTVLWKGNKESELSICGIVSLFLVKKIALDLTFQDAFDKNVLKYVCNIL